MGDMPTLGREQDAHLRDPERVRKRVLEAVAHWIGVANAYARKNGRSEIAVPPVRFDLSGRAAGQAVSTHAGERYVRINSDLLERYPVTLIQRTVPHEIAHVVTRAWWGRAARPHGREWKLVMALFGKEASRCHDMDVAPARATRVFGVTCNCGVVYKLGVKRYTRLQESARMGRPARCRRCKTTFRLQGEL